MAFTEAHERNTKHTFSSNRFQWRSMMDAAYTPNLGLFNKKVLSYDSTLTCSFIFFQFR